MAYYDTDIGPHWEDTTMTTDDTDITTLRKNDHTIRKNPYHDYSFFGETIIHRSRVTVRCDPESYIIEVPVTDIDAFFDSGFWQETTGSQGLFYWRGSNFRTLNSPKKWEEVQVALSQLAMKVTKEYLRYEGCVAIHYDVPVIGHYFHNGNIEKDSDSYLAITYDGLSKSERRKHKYPKHWLEWNGRFYDPSYIYQYVPFGSVSDSDIKTSSSINQYGYLKVICSRFNTSLQRETISSDAQAVLQAGSIKLGCGNRCCNKHNRLSGRGQRREGELHYDYLEIDLKRVCNISHIGTLGGYPTDLMVFPPLPPHEQRFYLKRKSYYRKLRPAMVYIAKDPSKLSWVSSYKVEYRDATTGKWQKLETLLEGNQDVGNEVFQPVAITTRYLRIIPVEIIAEGDMRVTVYGKPVHAEESRKYQGRSHSDDASSTAIETIRYTVRPSVHSNLRMDGYVGKDSYWDNELHPSRNNRHNKFLQDIGDAIKSLD